MGAWIEIHAHQTPCIRPKRSHSSWVRGLKFIIPQATPALANVALFMGAWIEMFSDDNTFSSSVSHSSWVRGLK